MTQQTASNLPPCVTVAAYGFHVGRGVENVFYEHCYISKNHLSLLLVNLYKIVVFPAPSRPSISILISFDPHSLEKRLEKKLPAILRIKNTETVKLKHLVHN